MMSHSKELLERMMKELIQAAERWDLEPKPVSLWWSEQVYSVFSFGRKRCSWSRITMDRIKGWETNVMRRLFRFGRKNDETWCDYRTRTARMARTVCNRMNFF